MMPTEEHQRDPEVDGPDHAPDDVEDDFEPEGGGGSDD